MNASSNEQMAVLAVISTKQVQHLLGIMADVSIRRIQFIESRFVEQGQNFNETVRFLEEIRWISKNGNEFALTADGDAARKTLNNDDETRKKIIEGVIGPNSLYRELLADYVTRFSHQNSELVYQPSITDRLQESPLRNLLMDMRVIEYRADDDLHVLVGDGVDLYILARNLKCRVSKKGIETAEKGQWELGFAAELAILAHEKQRVGTEWASKVEHVSSMNPFSSYDIKSVTLNGKTSETRYIEVKAVPGDSYQFYWTASEIELSRLVGKRYFLYLLPTVAGAGFDLAHLLMVGDPWASVRQNSDKWLIEDSVIVCRRKP